MFHVKHLEIVASDRWPGKPKTLNQQLTTNNKAQTIPLSDICTSDELEQPENPQKPFQPVTAREMFHVKQKGSEK